MLLTSSVGVLVGVFVATGVFDGVNDGVIVKVGVVLGVAVTVFVGVVVLVGVAVAVGVSVDVGVGVGVGVFDGVSVGNSATVGNTRVSCLPPKAPQPVMDTSTHDKIAAVNNLMIFSPEVLRLLYRIWWIVVVGVVCGACAAPTPPPTPTVPAPTVTPGMLASPMPTRAARAVLPTATATETPVPAATVPALPSAQFTPRPATLVSVDGPFGAVASLRVGESAGGRPIAAQRIGDGPVVVLLVGGVHGGWEANTVRLMNELIDHFQAQPGDLLPGVSLVIVPAMNPDGVAVGNSLEGRFNGNGVDLNRNWACGWQPEAVWREGPVDPGSGPMSEPETRAVAALVNRLSPTVALFYHSAANGIFAGDCARRTGEWRSGRMVAAYGEAANYPYAEAFSAYPVTGTAASWVDGLGIAAADVELSSATETQFERNLRGVMAVQCWALGPNDLPACN